MSRITACAIKIARHLAWFGAFILAYYAPFLLEPTELLASGSKRALSLFDEAVSTPLVQFEIARNILTHLGLLILAYVMLITLAHRFSKASKLSPSLTRLLFLFGCWVLLVAVNGTLFPLSNYTFTFAAIGKPSVAAAAAILLSLGSAWALWTTRAELPRRRLTVAAIITAIGLIVVLLPPNSNATAQSTARNIILIGVDSLSAEIWDAAGKDLPNLTALVNQSTHYRRTYTPLGRTFPAWTSILSGKTPAEHGAIFNLRNMENVDHKNLLPSTLKGMGYKTVFAIDERRFCNIDESFGFDHVVGPKAGVLDFLLQRVNDTPLTNLLLQTPLAKWLLPYSYINTASFANYDADGFVEQLLNQTAGSQPLFLAVHFETAHYPFKSRHSTKTIKDANRFRREHIEALTAVDEQVGQLMKGLAAQGRLNDTLVVTLSDHGEGLGDVETHRLEPEGELEVAGYGHGVSLISEHQSRAVLAMTPFANGHASGQHAERDDFTSLLDIRSAVEDYARTGVARLNPSQECITVETGIRFLAANNYKTIAPGELLAESADFYEVSAQGLMQLKESTLGTLVVAKDVGVRCKDRLTYYAPASGEYVTYVLTQEGINPRKVAVNTADVTRIKAYQQQLQATLRHGNLND
ncbi:MAG: sulfatase-like hydrolase/transferase [Pseudomonadota bacterium]